MIVDETVTMMAGLLSSTLQEGGLTPQDAALFAFGGNGPLFGALVAERLGIARVYVFTLGPVFSAFGSAISDVVHVYERGLGVDLRSARGKEEVAKVATALLNQARRDLLGEGVAVEQAAFALEAEMVEESEAVTTIGVENIPPENPSVASLGTRQAYWPEYGAFRQTPIYAFASLAPEAWKQRLSARS